MDKELRKGLLYAMSGVLVFAFANLVYRHSVALVMPLIPFAAIVFIDGALILAAIYAIVTLIGTPIPGTVTKAASTPAPSPGTSIEAVCEPDTASTLPLEAHPAFTNPEAVRATQLLESTPLWVKAATDDPDDPRGAAQIVVSGPVGCFTDASLVGRTFTLLNKGITPHKKWILTVDTATDTLTLNKKRAFPKIVTPPAPKHVVTSIQDAIAAYKELKFNFGVDIEGNVVSFSPQKQPHMAFIGGTGGGKSVGITTLVEDLRIAGFQEFIIDGKGTDYAKLQGVPNVSAISNTLPGHIALASLFADQVAQRKAKVLRENTPKSEGFELPPAVLIWDEFSDTISKIRAEYGKSAVEIVFAKLLTIVAVGREMRMHLVLGSQDVYADTLPGRIAGNIHTLLAFGNPQPRTLDALVSLPEQRDDAKRVGATISSNDRGRAMIVIGESESTRAGIIEMQGYWGYTPATSKFPPGVAEMEAWATYKREGSDKVPHLYPRIWFKVGEDFSKLDLEEILALPPVLLTKPDGMVIPEHQMYDPTSDMYIGEPSLESSFDIFGGAV